MSAVMKESNVMSLVPPNGETVAVSAVAQQCLRDCGNNIHEAQKMMERIVAGHPPLFRNLMNPLMAVACYDALRRVVRADRNKVWTAPNYTKEGNGDRLESLGLSLLDFPLPNGMALRLAHKADVLEGANFYATQAKDMTHKAAWLAAIAEKVGNKSVGEKFTAAKLQELQEATK